MPSTALDATALGNLVDVELMYAGLFSATFATCDGIVKEDKWLFADKHYTNIASKA